MPSPTQKFAMFRTAARYLTEPHPFARNPVTVKSHALDFSLYPKRIARTGAFVMPMAVLVLGWPMAAKLYGQKVGM
ncbi:hypothetical protein BU23DRAFT_14235 [Bimuria novae-zelandiae CBS 107.79]|uniref:Uncharacterized protein n=1 Tax=Bimuria novae-zelandiae CBS 107.79 TaxID=1447943 RepID=A0A6A5VH28_9PLEO|nr:hypothetical protein BU23DRAFT_14235 [Bimuria novae-zelandiae CBS 107.79]